MKNGKHVGSTRGTFAALVPMGRHAGRPAITLRRTITLVGSRENAHVHLVSQSVDPVHALLVCSGERMYVRDLASHSGVLVNGEPVREAELGRDDQLQIGSFLFRVSIPGDWRPGAEEPQAPGVLVAGEQTVMPEGRTVVIGRREGCDLVLGDPKASRLHAAVVEVDGVHVVRDLGSRAGTMVGEQRVHEQELEPGDVIRLAGEVVRYEAAGATLTEEPAGEEILDDLGLALEMPAEEGLLALEPAAEEDGWAAEEEPVAGAEDAGAAVEAEHGVKAEEAGQGEEVAQAEEGAEDQGAAVESERENGQAGDESLVVDAGAAEGEEHAEEAAIPLEGAAVDEVAEPEAETPQQAEDEELIPLDLGGVAEEPAAEAAEEQAALGGEAPVESSEAAGELTGEDAIETPAEEDREGGPQASGEAEAGDVLPMTPESVAAEAIAPEAYAAGIEKAREGEPAVNAEIKSTEEATAAEPIAAEGAAAEATAAEATEVETSDGAVQPADEPAGVAMDREEAAPAAGPAEEAVQAEPIAIAPDADEAGEELPGGAADEAAVEGVAEAEPLAVEEVRDEAAQEEQGEGEPVAIAPEADEPTAELPAAAVAEVAGEEAADPREQEVGGEVAEPVAEEVEEVPLEVAGGQIAPEEPAQEDRADSVHPLPLAQEDEDEIERLALEELARTDDVGGGPEAAEELAAEAPAALSRAAEPDDDQAAAEAQEAFAEAEQEPVASAEEPDGRLGDAIAAVEASAAEAGALQGQAETSAEFAQGAEESEGAVEPVAEESARTTDVERGGAEIPADAGLVSAEEAEKAQEPEPIAEAGAAAASDEGAESVAAVDALPSAAPDEIPVAEEDPHHDELANTPFAGTVAEEAVAAGASAPEEAIDAGTASGVSGGAEELAAAAPDASAAPAAETVAESPRPAEADRPLLGNQDMFVAGAALAWDDLSSLGRLPRTRGVEVSLPGAAFGMLAGVDRVGDVPSEPPVLPAQTPPAPAGREAAGTAAGAAPENAPAGLASQPEAPAEQLLGTLGVAGGAGESAGDAVEFEVPEQRPGGATGAQRPGQQAAAGFGQGLSGVKPPPASYGRGRSIKSLTGGAGRAVDVFSQLPVVVQDPVLGAVKPLPAAEQKGEAEAPSEPVPGSDAPEDAESVLGSLSPAADELPGDAPEESLPERKKPGMLRRIFRGRGKTLAVGGAVIGAGAAAYLLTPVNSVVHAEVRFHNCEKLSPVRRAALQFQERSILDDDSSRRAALEAVMGPGRAGGGFLAQPVAYSRVVDAAAQGELWPEDHPGCLVLTMESTEAEADRARFAALAQALVNAPANVAMAAHAKEAEARVKRAESALAEAEERLASGQKAAHSAQAAAEADPSMLEKAWQQASLATLRIQSEVQDLAMRKVASADPRMVEVQRRLAAAMAQEALAKSHFLTAARPGGERLASAEVAPAEPQSPPIGALSADKIARQEELDQARSDAESSVYAELPEVGGVFVRRGPDARRIYALGSGAASGLLLSGVMAAGDRRRRNAARRARGMMGYYPEEETVAV